MKTLSLNLIAAALLVSGADFPNKHQERALVVSNITYTVRYDIKSTNSFFTPATYPPGQPHYECVATIFSGTNRVGVIETQWTKDGCFEDSPILLIGRALGWKRYPNNSAGSGLHWVVKGPAMWAESDNQ